MARVKEVKRHVCSQCEEQITKCFLCGKWFDNNNEVIQCQSDGLRHICSACGD